MADAIPRSERPAKAAGTAALVVGRYALAAAAVAAAGGATLIIRHLTDSPTYFAFYAAIFVSIWFAGRGPGLMSLVLSSIAAHVLFHVAATSDPVTREVPTLLALLTCAVIADRLSSHRHSAEAALRAAGERLEAKVEERTRDLKRANEALVSEVADRKRAQAALQVAEERWRRLYEASAAGMALARADGVFTGANPAFQKMLDLTEDEIKGRTAVEFTHPDERATTVNVIADFKGGAMQEYHAEKRYLRRDGKPVWVNVTTTLVPALDESGPSLQAVYVDISERKRAEEALRASQERWRRVFESSDVPMALADGNRRIVAVNPTCERLLGYSHEKFVTMSVLDLKYGDEDRDVSAQMLAELEQGLRSAFQSELRFRHKDGTMIWVHASVSYVPATEVTPALFPAIIEDITQRKQAELERERLAMIVEKSGEAMGICDLDGIPLFLNRAGCGWSGSIAWTS